MMGNLQGIQYGNGFGSLLKTCGEMTNFHIRHTTQNPARAKKGESPCRLPEPKDAVLARKS